MAPITDYAYIYPYLTYCVTAWGNAHITYVNKLTLLHKKIIRALCNAHYLAHVTPLAFECNLLMFNDIYLFKLCKLMHNILYDKLHVLCVKYQCDPKMFEFGDARTSSRTCTYKFPISYVRTQTRKDSVFIHGISVWNCLDVNIRKIESVKLFCTALFNQIIITYL